METMIQTVLSYLASTFPVVATILLVLGSLVVIGQAYVATTKTLVDDEFLKKIEELPIVGTLLKVIARFAVIQRTQKPPENQ